VNACLNRETAGEWFLPETLKKLLRDLGVTFAGVLAALFVAMIVMTLYRDHLKVNAMWTAMNKPSAGPMIIPGHH
jgi:ABC-type phosphate/phosphonate transport system permease subunit